VVHNRARPASHNGSPSTDEFPRCAAVSKGGITNGVERQIGAIEVADGSEN